MDESLPTWVTILIAIMTAVGGGFGVWLLNVYNARNKHKLDEDAQKDNHQLARNKQDTELRISENEQAFKIYKELIDKLREDVNKMTGDMDKLEREHMATREENAALKVENRTLKQEIDNLDCKKNGCSMLRKQQELQSLEKK